ncbi:hypothetical protein AB0G74_16335 [Streptomyces sp. NPDC020875]|uniref:hypothetical protein n=1 Tax=Streptomyces sp. NPDC020875 TaxID=3154898 RepID=UPI0033DC9889
MDESEYPLNVIVDKIRYFLDQAGLLDAAEFEEFEDDVTELARGIISEVETSFGM